MKKYLSCALAALFVSSAVAWAADNDEAMAREKAAWQAYKDKNAGEFGKMMSDKYHGVYPEGIYDKAKELSEMQKMTLKSFELGDFNTVTTDADTLLVTYTVKMEATMEGKEISQKMNASSVWQKAGDDWKVVLHTNVPQATGKKKE